MDDIQSIECVLPHAAPIPVAVVIIDGLPRWEFLGQHPPLRPGLVEVEDGIDDIAFGVDRLRAAVVLGLEVMFDECPFGVRQIGVVHVC